MLNNSRSFLNFVIFDIKSCFYELFEWFNTLTTTGKNTFCVKNPFVLMLRQAQQDRPSDKDCCLLKVYPELAEGSKDEFERIQTGLDLS